MVIVQSYCSLGQVMLIFITSGSIYQRLFACPDVKKTPVLTVSVAWQSSAAIQLGGMVQLSTGTAVTSGLYAKCTAPRVAANQTAGSQC